MSRKSLILFVGSFKEAGQDGSVGGQMYACRSLLDSALREKYDWLLLDSTAKSNIRTMLLVRVAHAAKRLVLFLKFITTRRVDCCIIFTSNGWSFVEKGTMALVAKIFRKKVIIAPRSGLVVNDVQSSHFMRKVIVSSIRASDYVICQGTKWKDFYQSISGEPDRKFKVIQNWIATDRYLPASQIERHGKIRILYMSWVNENKGIFDLVTVAARLVRRERNLLFMIAGSGTAMEDLRRIIATKRLQNYFVLLGWVHGEKKFKLLRSSNVFVLPSYFEGYPNSLIEAMASGLPVLSTMAGSIPELVTHNQNGLLFDAGDTDAFESMLQRIVSDRDLRMRLGRNARTTVLHNNSLDSAVGKFTDIIESAIDGR